MKRRNIFNKNGLITRSFILVVIGINFLFFPAHAMAFDVKEGQPSHNRTGKVIKIDVHTLLNLMQFDPNLYLVDVRKIEEFNGPNGHIESAIHIDTDAIVKNPDQLPRGKTLVFISNSGSKGQRAARILADKGYAAYYLEGGMAEWNKLQNPEPDPEPEDDPGAEEPVEQDMGC